MNEGQNNTTVPLNYKDKYYYTPEAFALRHHLSTSVVSISQGSPASLDKVIYGYNNWDVESLVFMGTEDIFSYSQYEIGADKGLIKFQTPSDLLNNTENFDYGEGFKVTGKSYNELVFERSGLTPSYLVLYESMSPDIKQETYQAAYDWGIPIVYINK